MADRLRTRRSRWFRRAFAIAALAALALLTTPRIDSAPAMGSPISDEVAGGSAPLNDDFADAVAITSLPFSDSVDTTLATAEPGEPAPECLILDTLASTVWYSFTPTTDTLVLADTQGSDFNTAVAVYEGASLGDLSLVSCGLATFAPDFPDTMFAFEAIGGQTYFFQAGGPADMPYGAGDLWAGGDILEESQGPGFGGFRNSGSLTLNLDIHFVPPCPASQFSFDDPSGDTLGFEAPQHDILSMSGASDAESFCLTLEFAGPVGLVDSGLDEGLITAISLDTDSNAETGMPDPFDSSCTTPSGLGVEVLAAVMPGFGLLLPVASPTSIDGFGTLLLDETALTLVIPLAAMRGDDSFDFSIIVSSAFGPTDCAPNGGSISCVGGVCTLVPPPPAPPNDDFANSEIVTELPFSASASTALATLEPEEPQPCAGIGRTVWYSYTPVADVLLTADTFGSLYDTALAVHTGDSPSTLTTEACNDDSDYIFQSRVTISARAGVTYHFQVGGFFGDSGPLVFNLAETEPVDMSGVWKVAMDGGGTATCTQVVTQTGSDLVFETRCDVTWPMTSQLAMTSTGAIDQVTGDFFVSSSEGLCGYSSSDGTLSPDGNYMSGSWECMGFSGTFTGERKIVALGDVSCDGALDSVDAALVLQFGAGLLSSLLCEDKADVNVDGAINSIDAALILQYVADLIPSLPPY